MSVGTFLDRGPAPSGALRARGRALAADRAVLATTALTILAGALRFARIDHQGFWFDEGNTALLVHFDIGHMLGLIPSSESTPPLYYCVAWLWARAFGYSEAPLRALSALAGVLTVPVAFAAARKLFSPRAGVIAAALVACSPLLIWYSQEARSYELLVLFSSASLLAFAYAREDPVPRRLLAWVLAAGLTLATHYYAVLAVAPQAIWLLAAHRRRRGVQVAVAVLGACGLALIPLALSQNATGHANWIASAGLGRRLSQVAPQFLAGFQLPAQGVLVPVAGALALAGIALALLDARTRRHALGVVALALGGLALNLVIVAAGTDDLITRNVIVLWLPAALIVSAGLASRRAGLFGVLLTFALCGIGVTAAVGVAVNRDFQRPDWRGVARVLGARPAPATGPRAILIQHYRDLLPLALYLPGLRFMPHHGARVSELDVITFSSPPSGGFCWWGSACNLWPSTMQAAYTVPGFRPVWRRRVYQFTVLRMVAAAPQQVTPREIRRALTETRLGNDDLIVQR